MKLSENILGEIYKSLSSKDLENLDQYISVNYASKKNKLYKIHFFLYTAIVEGTINQFYISDLNDLVQENNTINTSLLTTYINKLYTIVKEFIILSKIKDKNHYTEILWGEYLIEHQLKRNLKLHISNKKILPFIDEYPVQKEYYHKREQLFYTYMDSNTKSYEKKIKISFEEIDAFEDFYVSKQLEFYITLVTIFNKYKSKNYSLPKTKINKIIQTGLKSNNENIKINSLLLALNIENSISIYFKLKKLFYELLEGIPYDYKYQIAMLLFNFCTNEIKKGNASFYKESYNLIKLLEEQNVFFNKEFLLHNNLNSYITIELKLGTVEQAEIILNKHIDKVGKIDYNSCLMLNKAKIEQARGAYKESNFHLLSINPKDSLYYFPNYKVCLIKNYVHLNEDDSVRMEKENLYRFIHKNKKFPEENQRLYILFIKYIEYMTVTKFMNLTPYLKNKIKEILLNDEYLFEKEWMQERFNYLESLLKHSRKSTRK